MNRPLSVKKWILGRARRRRRVGPRPAAPPGGPSGFDAAALEARLVWIWGSPRSGSTWLLRQLCHPARLSANFPLGFAPPPTGRAPLPALPVDEFLVSRHIAPPSGPPVDADGGLLPATLNNYVGDFPGYAFSRSYEDVWKPEVRRLILVRLNAMLERTRAAGVPFEPSAPIVIKEVNGSHAADLVMSLFPRARMLFLIRDGRDVIDSRVHAHSEGGWLAATEGPRFREPGERLAWVRDAAREWACGIDATRRAYEAHPPALRRSVRYEDLLRDNAGVLEGLFSWLGLDSDGTRIERVVADTAFDALPAERRGRTEPYRAASPGLWRQNMTAPEREALHEILGSRLEALDYPVDHPTSGSAGE